MEGKNKKIKDVISILLDCYPEITTKNHGELSGNPYLCEAIGEHEYSNQNEDN